MEEAVFRPCEPLLPGKTSRPTRAIVTIPARNEETNLTRCLDALGRQIDLDGRPLPRGCIEVLLLLNNCTDASKEVAETWQLRNPLTSLYIFERRLLGKEAHVGVARRLLMDTAWTRLQESGADSPAILTTDADTLVAPDWVASNLSALDGGADVVGGLVEVCSDDLASLPDRVRYCYEQDRRYACLVAQLEDAVDPQQGDRCPRHLDHFGSSLACTPHAYAAAGGMPAVSPLEDEAFIDRVRRAGLRLRHDPAVRVQTSGRLQGRASVGLAGQLCMWQGMASGEAHCVPSAAFLEHRFRSLRTLRSVFEAGHMGSLRLPSGWWREAFTEALRTETTCPGFLGAVYCDVLIAESFDGVTEEPIDQAIRALQRRVAPSRVEVSCEAAALT